MREPLVVDSATHLGPDARGRAALAASHGGVYAAYLCAKAGVSAVILCDAGIGRDRAGVSGLAYLDRFGVPAAAVGHRTAPIGMGSACRERGALSVVNAAAARLGLVPGMGAAQALRRLAEAGLPPCPEPPPETEARHPLPEAGSRVVALDSVSLVTPADVGRVVVTGSHGGLLGGRPETAVKVDVFAALYNDAGRGADDAGISRLPALDRRGIAGATVSAETARIGEGLSTYRDGVVSAVNDTAARLGGRVGQSARDLVAALAAALPGDRP